MDLRGSDRWQAAQSQSLLWVGVHPEVPNSQSGSHSLTSVGGWQGRRVGSVPVHSALSLTRYTPVHLHVLMIQ